MWKTWQANWNRSVTSVQLRNIILLYIKKKLFLRHSYYSDSYIGKICHIFVNVFKCKNWILLTGSVRSCLMLKEGGHTRIRTKDGLNQLNKMWMSTQAFLVLFSNILLIYCSRTSPLPQKSLSVLSISWCNNSGHFPPHMNLLTGETTQAGQLFAMSYLWHQGGGTMNNADNKHPSWQ